MPSDALQKQKIWVARKRPRTWLIIAMNYDTLIYAFNGSRWRSL